MAVGEQIQVDEAVAAVYVACVVGTSIHASLCVLALHPPRPVRFSTTVTATAAIATIAVAVNMCCHESPNTPGVVPGEAVAALW